ncbi:hypothetical protein [Rhodanobacter sp. L36]|uniref:hypothetical protein n=1 Tax=Rhodanobacter sp. L36 TaxID=1747221 RepID=UPI00131C991B|nr:hypothetical protein [Rhodanobacter sp. L36]
MVITSAIVLKQKRIAQAFERAAATTPGTAQTPQQLGIKQGLAWGQLVRHAVLRCPGEGRYFVDISNWQRLRRLRRRIAISIISALLIVLAVVLLVTRLH